MYDSWLYNIESKGSFYKSQRWRAPEDDGGIPIDNYVIEKMDTTTGRWVPTAKVREYSRNPKLNSRTQKKFDCIEEILPDKLRKVFNSINFTAQKHLHLVDTEYGKIESNAAVFAEKRLN